MENLTTTSKAPVSTLRLKAHEQEKVLRLLEAEQASSKHASRRKSERFSFPEGVGVTARIAQPGGTSGHFVVRGLNLSEHGIGIIHGGYVHAGSKAVVTLVTADEERFSINGAVKRCEYVTNGVHFVGIAFEAPFDLEGFLGGISDDADPQGGAKLPTLGVRVQGRVLVFDDSHAARRLTAYLLNRIGATVVEATSLEEVRRELEQTSVDLMLCDVWFGHEALPGYIDRLRELGGADTPIVVLTGDERQATRDRVLQAGCVEVLTKPVAPAGFNECIARYLDPVPPGESSDKQREIVSEYWSDLAMRPLIVRFVRDLDALVQRLDADLVNLDSEPGRLGAYNACMLIGADAGAYGFPSIQSLGNTMCMLIDGGAEAAELQSQLVDLQARVQAACRGL